MIWSSVPRDWRNVRIARVTWGRILPQLLGYAEALKQTGAASRVCGVAIFWVNDGEISKLALPGT